MPVLVTAEVKGQTLAGYDGMLVALEGLIKKAPGFVLHMAYPTQEGLRVVEVWDSKAEADQWYAKSVAPNLPPGIAPKRTYQELHSLVIS